LLYKKDGTFISRLFHSITIVDLKAKEITHIYVTGHSLGGALATLAALDLQIKFPELPVTMYNFGSPHVGEIDFVRHYNQVVMESFRIAFKEDNARNL
jgi:predicted lipase